MKKILFTTGIIFLMTSYGVGALVVSFVLGDWISDHTHSDVLGEAIGILLGTSLSILMGFILGLYRFLTKGKPKAFYE